MKNNELLAKLNEEQRQAVKHQTGPLLIVAGAGTGKTTVLINRLLYLVLEQKIKPNQILTLTFTEKATEELINRAETALPYGFFDLPIFTFHGLCEKLLREFGLRAGLGDFQIINETEAWILMRRHLDRFGLKNFKPIGEPAKHISEMLKHFSRLKEENISPEQYLEYAENLSDNDQELSKLDQLPLAAVEIKELANAYQTYNQLLADNNYLDFGDLQMKALKMLQDKPQILEYCRQRWSYIMIDEFQDTNWTQYEIIKLLAAPKNNLVAVGDDDQAIYKFRGASLANILQFKDDYPQAKEIVLKKNYRSGQPILDYAYRLITNNNPDRLEEKLKIDKKIISPTSQQAEIIYRHFNTFDEELFFVVEELKKLIKRGEPWHECAILARTNKTADIFANELTKHGLPNQFMSSKGLYLKSAVMNVVAYLKLLDDYHESSALFRVLCLPYFAINHQDLIKLNYFANEHKISLFEALKSTVNIKDLEPETTPKIEKLLDLIKKHSQLAKEVAPSKIVFDAVKEIILPYLDLDRDRQSLLYLNHFLKRVRQFEEKELNAKLSDYLDYFKLELAAGETGSMPVDEEDFDTIKLMTVHSAKGREFNNVFIVNLTERQFPSDDRRDALPIPDNLIKEKLTGGENHLAEERRLFYVALTRAKKNLYLTSASDHGGKRQKKPSRFIFEAGLIEKITQIPKNKKQIKWEDQKIEIKIPYFRPPKNYSYTHLDTYDKCPYQYKMRYILCLPTPLTPKLIFGNQLHAVLNEWLKPCLIDQREQANLFNQTNFKPPTKKDLFKLFDHYFKVGPYNNQAEADEFKNLGKKILNDFYENIITQQTWPRIIAQEKNINFNLKNYPFKVKPDRIDQLPDGSLAIIDYKTRKSKDKISFEEKKQLLIYQLGVESIFKQPVSQLSYYCLEDNRVEDFQANSKDLERVIDWATTIMKAIENGDFTPIPGHHCQYCGYHDLCEFRE